MARILLDCDGVLAEFTNHLCNQIALRCEGPDPKTFVEWDFIKHHLNVEQAKVAEDILEQEDFWLSQPLMPGAKDAVDLFRSEKHDVHFVTSPWWSCRTWADARTEWLCENLGIDRKNVHISSSKHVYSGAVFVDDRPSHVTAWQLEQNEQHYPDRKAFLFDAPYNQKIQWPEQYRVHGWSDRSAVSLMLEIMSGRMNGGFF